MRNVPRELPSKERAREERLFVTACSFRASLIRQSRERPQMMFPRRQRTTAALRTSAAAWGENGEFNVCSTQTLVQGKRPAYWGCSLAPSSVDSLISIREPHKLQQTVKERERSRISLGTSIVSPRVCLFSMAVLLRNQLEDSLQRPPPRRTKRKNEAERVVCRR